ncbi:MAG TPA: hypothetical protein VFD46_05290 [Chryseolinea sp.]|nr:hypothetical protein [Chryseolinea sp.]
MLTIFDASILSLTSIGFSGMTGVALLKLFQTRAQRLSRWAKKHPLKTRFALGIAQAGMGMTSLWLGNYLYESGVMIPEYARFSAAGIFTVAAIFYPTNYFSNGSPAFSYMQRKLHDAALFTAGAMITVYAGNHYSLVVRPTNFVQPATHITTTAENIISVTFAKRNISVVKKQFEARLKKYFEDPKGKTRGEKIALIIIASVGFAFLTAAVAAVSCNLSCSGNEAAAILVFLAGGALIAWGLTAALRSIHRSPTIEKRSKVEPLAK